MKKKYRDKTRKLLADLMHFQFIHKIAMLISSASEQRIRTQSLDAVKYIASYSKRKVIDGPFKGLEYPSNALESLEFAQKIIGTYESELHEILQAISSKSYELLVDIGAAEGYYAVGLARLFPELTMHAFEIDDERRNLCTEMAKLNGVHDRVIANGCCDHDSLRRLLAEKCGLVVADCTGCELELLSPVLVPELVRSDIIMELHEFETRGKTVSQRISKRFEATHRVEIVNVRPVKKVDHVDLSGFSELVAKNIVNEGRKFSIGWAFLESRFT